MRMFIQKVKMFVTEVTEDGGSSLQSWYGEPQCDEREATGWESEYYGETSDEGPAGPVEFVSEVEHPGEFSEADRVSGKRSARPLSASD